MANMLWGGSGDPPGLRGTRRATQGHPSDQGIRDRQAVHTEFYHSPQFNPVCSSEIEHHRSNRCIPGWTALKLRTISSTKTSVCLCSTVAL